MNTLQRLYEELKAQEQLHRQDIFNYAIPESWNLYGYNAYRRLRSKELLVNPYSFYLFTLEHMLKEADGQWIAPQQPIATTSKKGAWLKSANIYSLMVRTAGAWDHDRDDVVNDDNLYHLNDNGTFLKCLLLLPLLKRMGINTILLHQVFALCKSETVHTYAQKEAVVDFRLLDEQLADRLLPQMDAKAQCAAFIEACHHMGFRVLLEYCPGKLARENVYYHTHPEWFFWFDAHKKRTYAPPICHTLPQNTIPFTYTLKDYYKSPQVQEHIASFCAAPALSSEADLVEVEKNHQVTIAYAMVDQINANIPADPETTIWRLYEDVHSHVPKQLHKDAFPYLSHDIIRYDLHPARKAMPGLWELLCENITWYQEELGIDGLYLEKPYLLPEKLQKQMVKTARKNHPHFAMIAEDTIVENSQLWLNKGFDAISGPSAYKEGNIWNHRFHSFAYQLKGNECPMLAACEAYDYRRISSENDKTLTQMLTVMNLFLPNGIPMMMNGVEAYEVQSMQLSEYGDPKYRNLLEKSDPRYQQQAYLDPYWFEWRHKDLIELPTLLEKASALRKEYLKAIIDPDACIPAWFDSPQDAGLGFTYVLEKKALLVVCNTNIKEAVHLCVHTENMQLPFPLGSLLQVYSTKDPYRHDILMNTAGNIPLDFAPGEIKFIECKPV